MRKNTTEQETFVGILVFTAKAHEMLYLVQEGMHAACCACDVCVYL